MIEQPTTVEVLHPGLLTTVQDLGRPGYAHLGVSGSGAADAWSLRLGNRLVGNDERAAALESVLGGLIVRFTGATTFALTGAATFALTGAAAFVLTGAAAATAASTTARTAGPRAVDAFTAISVPGGTELRLGPPPSGLRTYLAVRGGIDVPTTLGSRSSDTLGGLGPAPLQAGDRLAVGELSTAPVSGALASMLPPPNRLRVVPGPREAYFAPGALAVLLETDWTVSGDSNRIGIRLDGPELQRRVGGGELPSEATLPGALQVPAHGRPILLGPDAPVTGGYPVIAVVHSADLHHCGQLRPGQRLRFTTAGNRR